MSSRERANRYAAGQLGTLSAVATCLRCTPEQAVLLAIRRARERFPTTDWSRWTFTAEEFGFGRKPAPPVPLGSRRHLLLVATVVLVIGLSQGRRAP